MQVIGIKTLAIKSVVLPGNMKERQVDPGVVALAENMEKLGVQLHEPWVRRLDNGTFKLIAGGDRVAAHMIRAVKEMPFKLVECTDREAADIEDSENAYRRHQPKKRDEALERMLARESVAVAAEPEAPAPATGRQKPGPKKGAKSKAIERVAVKAGVQPSSVRKSEQRAKARKQKAEAVAAVLEPPFRESTFTSVDALAESMRKDLDERIDQEKASPKIDAAVQKAEQQKAELLVDTMGFELEPATLLAWAKVHQSMMAVATKISQALLLLTDARKKELKIEPGKLQTLHARVHEVGQMVRAEIPVMLCPGCKGQDEYQPTCAYCRGLGYATQPQLGGMPKELLDRNYLRVMHNGKLVDLYPEPEQELDQQTSVEASYRERHPEPEPEDENAYEVDDSGAFEEPEDESGWG